MTLTITRVSDSATATPVDTVLPLEWGRETGNIETPLLDGSMAIALIPALPSAGQLTLIFDSEQDARDAWDLHSPADTFTYADSDHPARDLTYALGRGGCRLRRDTNTERWQVIVNFREVVA